VHEFVEEIPPDLEEGRLYVSIRYRTAVHLCACGCGDKVVTPIKPPRFHILFDGDSVSLTPSIGRWQSACRSHYWIEHNQVRWARAWTEKEIREGRLQDAEERRRYYAGRAEAREEKEAPASPTVFGRLRAWWRRVRSG
jgi:hypothetical protein